MTPSDGFAARFFTAYLSVAVAVAALGACAPDGHTTGSGGSIAGSTASGQGGGDASSSAGSGDASASSGSGAMSCTPGAQQPCYDGPASTIGVGACHQGVQTCKADGSSFGACANEVIPRAEDCSTPAVDDDCDGQAKCLGAPRWSRAYGSTGMSYGFSAAIDSKGDIYAAGEFSGTVDFGGGPRTAITDAVHALFVLKLDPTGAYLWDRVYDNGYNQDLNGVAVGPKDEVYLTGQFASSLDFHDGCQVAQVPISLDLFIAKLDPSGKCLWANDYGNDQNHEIGGEIAIAPNGNIAVAGRVDIGTFDLGGGVVISSAVTYGVFVAVFDPAGKALWAKNLGGSDPNLQTPQWSTVAFDSASDVVVGGYFIGSIDLDASTKLTSQGGEDVYVAKYDAGGALQWAHRAGDAGPYQYGVRVAVDGSDNVLFAGYYQGELTFDQTLPATDPWYSSFLVKIAPTGDYLWSKAFAGGEQQMYVVHADAMNDIVFAGVTDGAMTVGNGVTLPAPPGYAPFVIKLDASGQAIWAHDYPVGMGGSSAPMALASQANGDTVIVGFYEKQIDFADGDSPHAAMDGASDVFVADVGP